MAVLGLAHSFAYTVGAVVLAFGLWRRTGSTLMPAALGRMVGVAVVVGGAVWAASQALLGDDPSRLTSLLFLAVAGAAGAAAVLGAYQVLGVRSALSQRGAAA